MMKNNAFVYRWTDSSNGKKYIGSHKGSVDDGYIGSGKIFKLAYNKRKDFFSREVLYIGSYEDVLELEEFILVEVDAENNEDYYNLKNAALGGKTVYGESHHMKSKEHRDRVRLSMKGDKNHRYGKKTSDETRLKMSESRKGEKNPMYGIGKTVYCGYNGKHYETSVECANDLKHSVGYIRKMLTGKRKNKYQLKYITE
jgi:hypothetical protein